MLHPQTQKLRPALPSDALTKVFQGPTTRCVRRSRIRKPESATTALGSNLAETAAFADAPLRVPSALHSQGPTKMQLRLRIAGHTLMRKGESNWPSDGEEALCTVTLFPPIISNKTFPASRINLSDNASAILPSRLSSELLTTSAD